MAVIALLLTLVAPRYFSSVSRAEEATLRTNLSVLRDAIDKHYADNGKYPATLDELVKKKYLRTVPVDPITRTDTTWIVVAPEDPTKGGVYDVRTGAPGNGRDGTPYTSW